MSTADRAGWVVSFRTGSTSPPPPAHPTTSSHGGRGGGAGVHLAAQRCEWVATTGTVTCDDRVACRHPGSVDGSGQRRRRRRRGCRTDRGTTWHQRCRRCRRCRQGGVAGCQPGHLRSVAECHSHQFGFHRGYQPPLTVSAGACRHRRRWPLLAQLRATVGVWRCCGWRRRVQAVASGWLHWRREGGRRHVGRVPGQ